MRDLGVSSQVTVQGDAKVTLYVTGLDGTAVNLVARTDGLALPRNGLKLAFLIIEGYARGSGPRRQIIQILLESGAIILRHHYLVYFSVICKHCHFAIEGRI